MNNEGHPWGIALGGVLGLLNPATVLVSMWWNNRRVRRGEPGRLASFWELCDAKSRFLVFISPVSVAMIVIGLTMQFQR